MKILSVFLFVSMGISVVLGGVSPVSAELTEIDNRTAMCRLSNNIDNPDNYKWFLIESKAFESLTCGRFENSEFMTLCADLENHPAYARVCEGDLTQMITLNDLNDAISGEPNNCVSQSSYPKTETRVLDDCYTTTSEVREALKG